MADDADRAPDYNASALAAHMKRVNSAARGVGSLFCAECEEEIPAKRRAAQPGCTLCVDCQNRMEK